MKFLRRKRAKAEPQPEGRVFSLVGGRVTAHPPASAQKPATPTDREEQVRVLAYQKWEAAGRPDGDGLAFWLEAERELLGR